MSQNIYDADSVFFKNYSALDRSVHGLAGAPEWPRLRSFLPDLAGARVLDLGCGMGWFARWAVAEGGAASVYGVDLSSNMLSRARALTKGFSGGAAITYQQMDLDAAGLRLPGGGGGGYDVVYSSLTTHYITRLEALVAEVRRVLRPGGKFVFSTEHPITTAPSAPEMRVDGKGRKFWPLDEYQREGLRETRWLVDPGKEEGFRKQHRTVSTYLNVLLRAGFELTDYDDWCSHPQELEGFRWPYETEMVRPSFLLIGAKKK